MSSRAQRSRPSIASPTMIVTIGSLDQEGRGIARVDGKAVFVEGGLPGETVAITTLKKKPTFELARADAVLKANAARVEPRCPHFGVCGGCSQQHFDAGAQVAAKQRTLEDALWRLGRVRPELLLPPIHGPSWEYRHRARLSVRHVVKKGGTLIGFHERMSSYVADMTSCAVLPRKISDLLPNLRVLIGGLSVRDRLPQIELAVGDGPQAAHVLVLRILEPLAPADESALAAFAEAHAVQFYLQPGGPGTATPLSPASPPLAYVLPEFDLRFPYSPTEFTQVNPAINRVLVRRAVALLDPRPGERVADFFCGIGNFTLPIARRGAMVIGVEGSATLVERAAGIAALNGLAANATFHTANLFAATPESLEVLGALDKILVDPPREGAIALVKALPGDGGPRRIVYVSCNPATLARDASVLVHDHGYDLAAAGVINMFPHTSHVESIALFAR
ncbi:MAG: 23S rRNA (uracil(1939)-C(5))-methyltransferase RlmD [Casimicrobiaceae bacterium]